MAVVKTILKKTAQEAVVKVAGSGAATTISLANDLLPATQALTVGGTPTVNIIGAHWTGATGATITVVRNSVQTLTIPADQPTQFDFEGMGFVDTTNNTSDIVVTIGGAEAQVYLILRKVDGYSSKVETAQFGIYDNETVVGS
ncbi:hypothetical protein UFOVP240_177 [uncultured Caudovirales phage]|uniref:Uncharacterized protein n=1 Tax=uncultured Caudovirales phage TaxID=2100421 RepID=A0A6J7WXA0_9CAUD|nr:hypothetical protein UFOVP240_177 [uncultured Caudovirales phage]